MSTQGFPQPGHVVTMPAAPASLLDRIVEEQARDRARIADRYKPVMSAAEMVEREKQLQYLIDNVLKEGIDYGWVPGTNPNQQAKPGEYQAKPTLFKAGAERINAFFGYVPDFSPEEIIERWTAQEFGEPLFYYRYKCNLQKDGAAVGQGIGSATTWESKYHYRKGERSCTACGKSGTIIKGKAEYGGGWLCYKNRGGCGAKFKDGDETIESQSSERVPNPDFADVVNTVQKMAQKRAYVAATLTATGMSGRFTQDLEDLPAPPMPASQRQQANEPAAELPPAPTDTQKPTRKPKAEEQIAPRLAELWAQCDTDIPAALTSINDEIYGKVGDDEAGRAWVNALKANKVANWEQMDIATAKKVVRDLWSYSIRVQPEPTAE